MILIAVNLSLKSLEMERITMKLIISLNSFESKKTTINSKVILEEFDLNLTPLIN